MNEQQAIKSATNIARKNECIMYVVYESDQGFDYADDYNMDTFYLGLEPIHAIDCDGIID